jgi:hypothetical protein
LPSASGDLAEQVVLVVDGLVEHCLDADDGD